MKTIHFFLFSIMALVFTSCQSNAQDANTKRDIANIKAAYEALNQRNFDAFVALCADDYVDVNVAPTPTKGAQNAVEIYKQFLSGFPDFKLNITDIAPAGNGKYLLRLKITGTHTAPFMGIPPTGKSINFNDADVVVMNSDGKCVSHEITNTGEPLVQIGYASMMSPSTQVVMQAYEKFGKADIPGLLAICDEKVQFDIEDPMFDAKPRLFNGKAEVGKFFEELGGKIKYSKFQPTRFAADGEDVFVLVETEYEHPATKKKYASQYTHHFKVANGKVTFFRGTDGLAKQI